MELTDNPRGYPHTFLSLPATQTWDDLLGWELFFNAHPLAGFVELGTGDGGMSLYLALQCAQRGITFMTVDHQRWIDAGRGVMGMLAGAGRFRFECVTLLEEPGNSVVRDFLAAHHPVMLYCDDGNKPREWATFVPGLRAGDYVAAHDYGVEFFDANATGPVHPVMLDWCQREKSITRWYKVT